VLLQRWLGLVFDGNMVSYVAGGIAGVFYTFVSGMAVSSLRALSMILFSLLMVRESNREIPISSFFFALLLVVVSDPASVVLPSFVLSFGISLYIILVVRSRKDLGRSAVSASFIVTLTAYIVSVPLSIVYFQRVALFGFLFNFIFLPFFVPLIGAGVVWMGFCLTGSGFAYNLAKPLVFSSNVIIELLARCVDGTGAGEVEIFLKPFSIAVFFLAFTVILLVSLHDEN
jgi:ComEC/Rec2-related protein